MPQSLSQVYIHMVFSTKNHAPFLTPAIRPEAHSYLAGTLNGIECPTLQVGGVEDHVHLLFRLSRTHSIADVAEAVKTSSSVWMKSKGQAFSDFHWQSGYGAFSLSQSDTKAAVTYIRNQERHHKKMTFKDEFRALLTKYEIEFDERYVWD